VYLEFYRELPPGLRQDARGKRDLYEQHVKDAINDGVRSGVFKTESVSIATFAFFGIVNWSYHWYRPKGQFDYEYVASILYDIFLTGLRAPGDGGGEPQA
jgi:hypothetical protein